MQKALLLSTVAMFVVFLCYYPTVRLVGSNVADLIVWAIPFVGGFVAAAISPIRKYKSGVIATVISIALVAVGSYVVGALGFGDFVGWEGTFIGMLLYLPIFVIFGLGGAAFAVQRSRSKNDA